MASSAFRDVDCFNPCSAVLIAVLQSLRKIAKYLYNMVLREMVPRVQFEYQDMVYSSRLPYVDIYGQKQYHEYHQEWTPV